MTGSDLNPNNAAEDRMVHVARLWSQAQPIVGGMIAGQVPDFHDAEDLVGQVAEAVVRSFHEYDSSRPFVPWALGIAHNLVLRHYQKQSRERHTYFDEPTLQLIASAHLAAADELPARMAALRDCIQAIQGKSRRVLEMRYMHGLKPEVIADALEMKRGAVWVVLHRVRNTLKECIERKLAREASR